MAQEGVDFDVVIVDEGSTDETPEMLRLLPRERVHVLRPDQAKGVSAARNAGIAAATGEWVAFVDDDDIWAPTRLSAQLAAARKAPGAGWVCCGAVVVDARLQIRGLERTPVVSSIGDLLLARNGGVVQYGRLRSLDQTGPGL